MKISLIVAFFSLATIASATDYYISSSGNDSNNGISSTTPWKTIAKVNSAFSNMKPGDRVLFNRNDTFYGTLTISKSGSAGNSITISAYGTGVNPVITGFITLNNWANYGGGIYSKEIICSGKPVSMVTLNGIPQPLGRYPNTGYLTFESHNASTSITDITLTGTPNWTGAELVLRPTAWDLYRVPIANHSGSTLNYDNSGTSFQHGDPVNGWGYFIQNSLKTLDKLGEWFYDGKAIYMYFGDKDPNSYTIKASTLDRLVDVRGVLFGESREYIDINGISLEGSNVAAIGITHYKYVNIRNCRIDYSGSNGIAYIDDMYDSYGLTVDNCTINNSLDTGIKLNPNCINSTITNNSITNTGLNPGMGSKSEGAFFTGLLSWGDGSLIQYNSIENVGRHGIWFFGNNTTVKNNFINNFCLKLEDSGGIYLSDWKVTQGKKILENIVINGIGNREGVPNTYPEADGIYLDYATNDVEVSNNTVANCRGSGLILASASNVSVKNNTNYNNEYQILLQQSQTKYPLNNITITGNIFISKEATQICMYYKTYLDNFIGIGFSDNNFYARPLNDNNVFHIYQPSTGYSLRTLNEWQLLSGHDVNSHKSPIAITKSTDLVFEYNASKSNKVLTLAQPMIDINGTKYVKSVTLLPYTSIILMIDPNPVKPIIPLYIKSSVEGITPSLLELTYDINLAIIVPAPAAFSVQAKGVNRTVTSVAISGSKVRLTLSAPIVYGDNVTVSYTAPSVNKLQSLSGGVAATIINQPVTNNCPDLIKSNAPPSPVIKSLPTTYSGFIGEIDASGSFDLNNDALAYEWIAPNNVPVNSVSNSKINFLAPFVSDSRIYEFILKINDGISIVTKIVPITIVPYKPELEAAKISAISASSYQSPDFPNNVSDGILSTKWSAMGDNQWLLFNLTETFQISHLEIAFLPGQKCYSYFDIYASKDNLSWEPILTRASSCNFSGDSHIFDLPEEKKKSDYLFVKLVGHGNSLNELNNIAEFNIYGKISAKVGTSYSEGRKIRIYPNPANTFFNILIDESSFEPDNFILHDLFGRVALESPIIPGNNRIQIPSCLKNDIYIVELRIGNITLETEKLVIIR